MGGEQMAASEWTAVGLPLATSMVTAIVSAAGIQVREWQQQRSSVGRHKRALAQASAQIAFASEWYRAQVLVAPEGAAGRDASEQAARWIEEASSWVQAAERPRLQRPTAFSYQRMLLFYNMHRWSARLALVLCYLSVLLVVAAAITIPHDISSTESDHGYVASDIVLAAVSGALTVLFWAVTVHLEEPTPQDVGASKRSIDLVQDSIPADLSTPTKRLDHDGEVSANPSPN